MSTVYPLSERGAAAEMREKLVASEAVTLADLTPWPRFGLKGGGAADWFAARLPLPRLPLGRNRVW